MDFSKLLQDPGTTTHFPQQFSIREMLLRGTAVCYKEWRTLLLLQVVTFVILYVAEVLVFGTFPGTFAHFVAFALKSGLQLIVSLGLLYLYIRLVDGESVEVLDIFEPIERFWGYAGVMILYAIIVIVGVVMLVIPGVIAACGLSFAQYLAIEKNMMPVDALQTSWRKTEGHRMNILFFLLAIILINIIGAVTVVGVIITVPVSGIAYAALYRYFFPRATSNAS